MDSERFLSQATMPLLRLPQGAPRVVIARWFATLLWFPRGWVQRVAAAIWMNVLIGAVVVVAGLTVGILPDDPETTGHGWAFRALTLFAVWLLSFLPGWLYVRFLGLRAGALWNEYVLNLYRLGADDIKYLPPPPKDSRFAEVPDSGHGGSRGDNIYRQKFDAYYGRQVSEKSGRGEDFTVNVETLFPVFLCTSTLAVAWSVLLWEPVSVIDPAEPWAALEFGFLGAYAFAVSMLVRRFYQSDLRPSAYATVVLRIVLVMLIVIVLHQLFAVTAAASPVTNQSEMVVAFVVGFFPLIGLQALQRAAAKVLHVFVPQLAPDYPLDQLDGLNIWYEARLVEEGVEDMQNLSTMNLVDVILHTRAPVGRLIDWVDQAFLLIHLDCADRDELAAARKATDPGQLNPRNGAVTRVALRRVGVRSATDLLKTFGPDAPGSPGGSAPSLPPESLRACGLDPDQLDLLVRLLGAERGLDPVWNWKDGGASRLAPVWTPATIEAPDHPPTARVHSSVAAWSGTDW